MTLREAWLDGRPRESLVVVGKWNCAMEALRILAFFLVPIDRYLFNLDFRADSEKSWGECTNGRLLADGTGRGVDFG